MSLGFLAQKSFNVGDFHIGLDVRKERVMSWKYISALSL